MNIRHNHLWLCLMFAVLFCSPLPVAWAAGDCEPWMAQVVSIEGRVEARRAGQVLWEPVSFQETFCGGDSIRVEARSRAAILLRNETLLRLDQGTAITFSEIEEQQPTWLDLIRGAVHFLSRVPRTLKIRTAFVNAAIEGTEFAIRVDPQQARVWVFEGRVLASNQAGSLTLMSGQAALARVGQAPVSHVVVRPRDAVQWALYYPPIIDYRAAVYPPDPGVPAIQEALARYQAGDLQGAFASLETVPAGLRDMRYYTLRAGLLLSVGRVDEARSDIEQILDIDLDNANAFALQAIIALVQTEKDRALTLAQKATELAPRSPIPQVALSYAHQARFDIDKALDAAQEAINLDPANALAWARLAELWLAMGRLNRALKAAQQSVRRNPDMARTQTVLGFAYLTRIETKQARAAFEKAIVLDQADPLPRLGLGLARIRASNLHQGRREIEIAASLDPNYSIIRSYLGKAYFEEKRNRIAGTELAIAKGLDPNDPTPWFYDAIRQQTQNQPVAALHNLQRSIELNDNRAVYRSRLLLDQDLAARSANLARIYADLGFEQRALLEGWKSVTADPSSASAHRLLADSYASLPRHEIARVSELLQAQLLQRLNINPLQPQLAESNLGILDGTGPSKLSFTEFTPLFTRNGAGLQADGVIAGNDTIGNDLILSGVQGTFSYSLGQFHFETDGFRENNDQERDVYNAFLQANLAYETSVQFEYRHSDANIGDLSFRFDPTDFRPSLRENQRKKSVRLGFRHRFRPSSDVLGSLSYQDLNISQNDTDSALDREDRGHFLELQYMHQSTNWNIVSGIGYFDGTSESNIRLNLDPFICTLIACESRDDEDIRQTNLYTYSLFTYPSTVTWTLGLSVEDIDNDLVDDTRVNPKFGLSWRAAPATTIRLAAFRSSKRELVANQTLEPTHVAGFNQFFDEIRSTDSWRYGVGIDHKISDAIFAGAEFSQRDLRVPFIELGDPPRSGEVDWDEGFGRGYLYWTPTTWSSFSAEYVFERFETDRKLVDEGVLDLKTHSVPLTFRTFHPSGFTTLLRVIYANQRGTFFDSTVPPAGLATSDNDAFWIFDAGLGYRLPRRLGLLSFEVRNLFDTGFNFQDAVPGRPTTSFDEPRFARDRLFVGQVTLIF